MNQLVQIPTSWQPKAEYATQTGIPVRHPGIVGILRHSTFPGPPRCCRRWIHSLAVFAMSTRIVQSLETIASARRHKPSDQLPSATQSDRGSPAPFALLVPGSVGGEADRRVLGANS